MDNSMITTVVYFVVIIAIFYFAFIRPDRKRKKQQEEMRNSLKVGDEITTIGGIIGIIVDITDDCVVFETSEDRVRIQIARWAISTVGKETAAK